MQTLEHVNILTSAKSPHLFVFLHVYNRAVEEGGRVNLDPVSGLRSELPIFWQIVCWFFLKHQLPLNSLLLLPKMYIFCVVNVVGSLQLCCSQLINLQSPQLWMSLVKTVKCVNWRHWKLVYPSQYQNNTICTLYNNLLWRENYSPVIVPNYLGVPVPIKYFIN